MRPLNALLGLMVLPALLGACSNDALLKPQATSPQITQDCNRTHELINDYRKQRGFSTLQRHPGLDQLAQSHCQWLIKHRGTSFLHGENVSHSGSHWRQRVARIKYHMSSYGENVAAIISKPKDTPPHLVLIWQVSPSHHSTMLGNWTDAGIAIMIDDDGAIFATQVFGHRDDESLNPP